MKAFKYVLIGVLLFANLVFASPAFADRPKFSKNPDYIELNQELAQLKTAKETQAPVEGYTTEQIDNRLNELELQKYALESGINWGQCRNETGKTLAVYGPEPNADEDDDYSSAAALYFLADNQTTKSKWDCKGVYLPGDVTAIAVSQYRENQELTGGAVIKVPNGTNLVLKTNPDTGNVEFNTAGVKVLKPGEINWFIPNVSQAIVDTRVTNAPVNKG